MLNEKAGPSLASGQLIAGKYRLLHQVGEGAMGAVWAARNEATSGNVALKLLLDPDAELRQRLHREARAGALLKHRHILDVYDKGETAMGEPFLVMQLLSGRTLTSLLKERRRLDPPVAAAIGCDIARALSAAHAVQIVHRDLKPANVFLHNEPGEDEPVVKVLDFGVAKDLSSSDSLRTAFGSVVGSLYYMSPEQARAEPDIDHRADLWALGVVLFEMLTGVRPFQGDTNQVFAAVLNGEIPSVTRHLRRIDDGFARIVDGCLRRNRDERFGTAAEIVKALHAFAGVEGDSAGRAAAEAESGAPARASRVSQAELDVPIEADGPTVMLPPKRPPSDPPPKRAQEWTTTVPLYDVAAASIGKTTLPLCDVEPEPAGRPSGRISTEPLVKPDEPAGEDKPRSGPRRGLRLAMTAAGIALGLGLCAAALPRVLARAAVQAAPEPEEAAAQPSVVAPTEIIPPPAAPPEIPASTMEQPPLEPEPIASAVPEPSETTPRGAALKKEEPCADLTGLLLVECKRKQRRLAEEAKRRRADETYEDDSPY